MCDSKSKTKTAAILLNKKSIWIAKRLGLLKSNNFLKEILSQSNFYRVTPLLHKRVIDKKGIVKIFLRRFPEEEKSYKKKI